MKAIPIMLLFVFLAMSSNAIASPSTDNALSLAFPPQAKSTYSDSGDLAIWLSQVLNLSKPNLSLIREFPYSFMHINELVNAEELHINSSEVCIASESGSVCDQGQLPYKGTSWDFAYASVNSGIPSASDPIIYVDVYTDYDSGDGPKVDNESDGIQSLKILSTKLGIPLTGNEKYSTELMKDWRSNGSFVSAVRATVYSESLGWSVRFANQMSATWIIGEHNPRWIQIFPWYTLSTASPVVSESQAVMIAEAKADQLGPNGQLISKDIGLTVHPFKGRAFEVRLNYNDSKWVTDASGHNVLDGRWLYYSIWVDTELATVVHYQRDTVVTDASVGTNDNMNALVLGVVAGVVLIITIGLIIILRKRWISKSKSITSNEDVKPPLTANR